jgi:hypothetical protein
MIHLKWVSKMAAIKKSLTIEQYSTFKARFTWLDKNKRAINLTGYTAVMQMRDAVGSPVLLELSLTDEETGALTFKSAIYDLVLISATGQATRLLEGKVTVSPGVTHV